MVVRAFNSFSVPAPSGSRRASSGKSSPPPARCRATVSQSHLPDPTFFWAITTPFLVPLSISPTPDWRILVFNLALSVLTGIIFGLVPALQATRPDVAPTLKDQAGSVAGDLSVGLRKSLVIGQVSLSLLLLVGAGLFIRSLRNLKELDPGFPISEVESPGIPSCIPGAIPSSSSTQSLLGC